MLFEPNEKPHSIYLHISAQVEEQFTNDILRAEDILLCRNQNQLGKG